MNIKVFLFGFLLICIPLFRQDFFVRHSTVFPIYFFLFPIGLVILLWSFSGNRLRRLAILLGIFAIVELALVGSVAYMAHYQRYKPLSDGYYDWIRGQYGFFRSTTNFNSDLSRYDSLLTYRFRSNITGRFTNPEFNVEVKTNSLGVRDDEASLRHPAVVVLGDSHGMGWGVEQQDRFSEVFEKRLGVNVLNTAITSYGTHRETRLLNEVDLDSCRLLVIQYCYNDLEENKANLAEAQKPGIDAFGFGVAEKENTINKTYFPYKGLFLSLRWLIVSGLKSAAQPAPQPTTSQQVAASPVVKSEHADNFFPYLSRIRERYQGPIVVFDLGTYNFPIVKEFQTYHPAQPITGVYFVNVHSFLNQRDYFTIDDHINARGHAKIGIALAGLAKKRKWLDSTQYLSANNR